MYIDFLLPKFISKILGASIFGHLAAQSPQPLHLISSTYRGFLTAVTLKFPGLPDIFLTSDNVSISILGFL